MNIKKFTQKSIESINNTEKIAYEYGNQKLEQLHFLYALIMIEDSLIKNLLEKMNVPVNALINNVEERISKLPKVNGAEKYMSNDLNTVLIDAEDEAKRMSDEYVSVEHLFLSLIRHADREVKEVFKLYEV